MGLKARNWRKNIPKILTIIVVVILACGLVKVFIWEQNYYASKEGQERASAKNLLPADTTEVSELEITPEEVVEHNVAPDQPRYLTIEKLGIENARILAVGSTSDGSMQVPANIYDVGWYDKSGRPGLGGTLLLDGHNGGPTKSGVFKQLPSLITGDIIKVERGDGQIFTYSVVESESVYLNEANDKMSKMQESPTPGVESLSLISCTGEWSQTKQTYLSRQFVRAILLKNSE